MMTGIQHIALLVSSEKTLTIYKLLGFEETFRKERASDTVVLLDGYEMQLEVFIDSRHPVRTADVTEPLGPRHFALKVDNIETEIERLQNIFRECEDYDPQFGNVSLDWIGERYVFFNDPDGNVIELHE